MTQTADFQVHFALIENSSIDNVNRESYEQSVQRCIGCSESYLCIHALSYGVSNDFFVFFFR